MASIRKRGDKYQVQVRKKGHRQLTKSFISLANARKWARLTEAKIELGDFAESDTSTSPLSDLLNRYLTEVSPQKKGYEIEAIRIGRLLRDPVSSILWNQLTTVDLAKFRDRRLKCGQRACQIDLVLLRHVLKIARSEWGITLPNDPFANLTFPPPLKGRRRRLEGDEWVRLKAAASKCKNKYLLPVIELALETAMRRGELLGAKWADFDEEKGLLLLRDTKNGEDRLVPLSSRAQGILENLPGGHQHIIPITPNALRLNWVRALRRAKIEDLHFHDLRHEAISRLFERGLSVAEVQLISGHKTVSQLFKYTHLRAEDVRSKLQ